jgi:hypothetical protein
MIDPKKWKPRPSSVPARQEFQHKTGDGYAVIIAERVELDPAALRSAALTNAKLVSPDAAVIHEEARIANGTEVLMLQFTATIAGARLSYMGYYWTGPAGTVQVLTYTGQNLLREYQADLEEFLNGFKAP